MSDVITRIEDVGIVPVIVLDDPDLAAPLADALAGGGLPCAEVTFRTAHAAEALKVMARDPRLLVGAGTVLTIALVKFFPAEAIGGTKTLSAMAAPFPRLRFVPTGGISPDNLEGYLTLSSVAAVGGSWMASAGLVSQRRWDDVSRLAAEAIAAVARCRPATRVIPACSGYLGMDGL
jgi:2-dehydro-3-deoxyphosphogluconate aldolase/(4S)-4-hydroxy-2-oxoglutarate aldolase